MPADPRKRVSMLSPLRSELGFNTALGVMKYGLHAKHWRFVSRGSAPFVTVDEVERGDIKVDGVIGPFDSADDAKRLLRVGAVVVNTGNEKGSLGLPTVSHDDEAFGSSGAAYLLERGFTNFGFFAREGSWLSDRRCAGFRNVIEGAGRRCHVQVYRLADADERPLARAWLEGLPRPIAIMTHKDYLGWTTINAAEQMGLRVPEDIAVLGATNNFWATVIASTTLSSIVPNSERVGYLAAEMLDEVMRGAIPPPRWVTPLGVATRGSTDITLTDDPLVTGVLGYIREHCGERIHVEDLLDHAGVSRRNLELRMKRAVGITPRAAIQRGQIEKAKKLLVQTPQAIEKIAYACGFRQPSRLNETFRRHVGMTPGEFRNQGLQQPQDIDTHFD